MASVVEGRSAVCVLPHKATTYTVVILIYTDVPKSLRRFVLDISRHQRLQVLPFVW